MITAQRLDDILSQIKQRLIKGERVVQLGGFTSISAKSYLLGQLMKAVKRQFVVVTASNSQLGEWVSDLNFWSTVGDGDMRVVSVPSFEG